MTLRFWNWTPFCWRCAFVDKAQPPCIKPSTFQRVSSGSVRLHHSKALLIVFENLLRFCEGRLSMLFFQVKSCWSKRIDICNQDFWGPRLPVLRLENNFRAIWYLVYNLQGLKRHHSISRIALLEAEENGLLPGRYTKPRSLYGMEVLKFSLKLTLSSSALAIWS